VQLNYLLHHRYSATSLIWYLLLFDVVEMTMMWWKVHGCVFYIDATECSLSDGSRNWGLLTYWVWIQQKQVRSLSHLGAIADMS
jgi:hypothetical protein